MKKYNYSKLEYKIVVHFLPHKYSYAQKYRGNLILKRLKKGKLLDIGVGCGWLSRLAKEKGFKVIGIDNAEKVIKENNWFSRKTSNRISVKKASAYKLPFKSKTFDSVVLSEILEHLVKPKKALEEARRVLKDDGKLAVLVPGYSYLLIYDRLASPLARLKMFNYDKKFGKRLLKFNITHETEFEDEHRLDYSVNKIKSLIEKSGFKVDKVENTEFLSPFINSFFCNCLNIKRTKITFLEKIDVFLLNKIPLFIGSDWLFTCSKEIV